MDRHIKDPGLFLSGAKAKSVVTELRKAANHPLLLRIHFSDTEVLSSIATTLYSRGVFGFECTLDQALKEIETYSDFDIHKLCLEHTM
jgi:SWI/SNF-related matrix-associated actin-dependent regulator 1 of chromatin subfamily A